MESRGTIRKQLGAQILCLLGSIAVHLLILPLLPIGQERSGSAALPVEKRSVQLRLRAAQEKTTPQSPPPRERRFAKTDPDHPQQRPEQANFIGARNNRADSDPTVREQTRDFLPAAEGKKREEEEEIVTFDSERREGDLHSETNAQQTSTTPAATPHETDTETEATDSAGKESSDAPGLTDARGQKSSAAQAEPAPAEQQTSEPSTDSFSADAAPRARSVRAVYDPALAPAAQQPGFRTQERKTRSRGQFILGKGAALNVEASPRGQYEAEIYRRIARSWYSACDEHRGDIIPGHLTLSLRLNRQGQLVNMQLLRRSGASVSQQSFTFAAVRRAALPPMPAAVQEEVVGDLLELIFTFHFD